MLFLVISNKNKENEMKITKSERRQAPTGFLGKLARLDELDKLAELDKIECTV